MFDTSQAAYRYGEDTAIRDFGLTKEAFAPLAALAPLAVPALRAAGTWAATKALPWLARGAAGIGKSVAKQAPGALAQTGTMMAADKMTQPRQGPPPAPTPGMLNQGMLPGMAG